MSLSEQVWQDLSGAVDESGGPGAFAVHAMIADDGHTAVFLGALAFRVTTDGEPERIELYRDPAHEEYWDTMVLAVREKSLVIYEAGVMLLSEGLRVEWHRQKLYNDVFLSLDQDVVWFETDSDERWGISLQTGSRVS